MSRIRLLAPLVFLGFIACETTDAPTTADERLAPAGGLATAVRIPFNFFFLNDFDRDYSATVGLVSDVADLGTFPDCGGSGPEIYDGGGVTRFVTTPKGSAKIRNRLQKATFVLYDGATDDVCALPSHPVVARGKVNFNFNTTVSVVTDTLVTFKVLFAGIVTLTSGGKAHVLGNANFNFDVNGNTTIRVDRFVLKPIGH